MKKLIFILVLALALSTAHAQTATGQDASPTVPLDALSPRQPANQAAATTKTLPTSRTRTVRTKARRATARPQSTRQTPAQPGVAAQTPPTPKAPKTTGNPRTHGLQVPALAADQHTTPIQELVPPRIVVKLERIRVQRTLTFAKNLDVSTPSNPESELTDPREAEEWFPAMTMQFRLDSPKDWDMINVEEARVLRVLDQNGQPIPSMAQEAGAPSRTVGGKANPLIPLVHMTNTGASVLIRTTPPPQENRELKELDVVFKVTLGYKRVVYVKDIRRQVSQPLLHTAQVTDLAMQLNQVGEDKVELVGLGNLNRVGEVLFADEQGKPLEPYTSETVVPEIKRSSKDPLRQWNYAFASLPEKVNMTIGVYPTVSHKTSTVKFKLPLP